HTRQPPGLGLRSAQVRMGSCLLTASRRSTASRGQSLCERTIRPHRTARPMRSAALEDEQRPEQGSLRTKAVPPEHREARRAGARRLDAGRAPVPTIEPGLRGASPRGRYEANQPARADVNAGAADDLDGSAGRFVCEVELGIMDQGEEQALAVR